MSDFKVYASDSDNDEVSEFFERVQAGQPEVEKGAIARARDERPTGSDDDKPLGVPTQYAFAGAGYMPTTASAKKLPAGVYKINWMNNTPYFDPVKLRTDKILRLPDSKSAEVVAEIEAHWATDPKAFYDEGLLLKLGFLLWGPPGSGKTMTVQIVIEEMIKRGGVVLLVESPDSAGEMMNYFRQIEKKRPMVAVMEDLDAIVQKFGEPSLLSLMDGEHQIDNVVWIATTNYPERLDSRLVNRTGRFDYIVKIGMPNAEARAAYLKAKNKPLVVKDPDGNDVDLIAGSEGLSLAHMRDIIRDVFVRKQDPRKTLKRLNRMKVLPKSTGGNKMGIGNREEDES